jgi:hypothetical protein
MPFNILYKRRTIHKNLSREQCVEILEEYSSEYYTDEELDINEFEMEEV